MDMKELIEAISKCGSDWSLFNITMQNTQSPMYSNAVDCRGDVVARCDYFGASTEVRIIRDADDAIGFLFDCDVHMWELVSVDRICVKGSSSMVQWNITLRR